MPEPAFKKKTDEERKLKPRRTVVATRPGFWVPGQGKPGVRVVKGVELEVSGERADQLVASGEAVEVGKKLPTKRDIKKKRQRPEPQPPLTPTHVESDDEDDD